MFTTLGICEGGRGAIDDVYIRAIISALLQSRRFWEQLAGGPVAARCPGLAYGSVLVNLYLVRHGETDYGQVQARGVRGWATSFAPLTPRGRLQIDTIARDYRLQDAQAILCSSYARALESAARLSRALNKPLYVEYDLHEWLPQKDSLADLEPQLLHRANERLRSELRGLPLAAEEVPWESLAEVRSRVVSVLQRYRHLSDVVVVTHAVVISALVGVERLIDHAEIVPYNLDLDSSLATSETEQESV